MPVKNCIEFCRASLRSVVYAGAALARGAMAKTTCEIRINPRTFFVVRKGAIAGGNNSQVTHRSGRSSGWNLEDGVCGHWWRQRPTKQKHRDIDYLMSLGHVQPIGVFKTTEILVSGGIKWLCYQESWYEGRPWLEYSSAWDALLGVSTAGFSNLLLLVSYIILAENQW